VKIRFAFWLPSLLILAATPATANQDVPWAQIAYSSCVAKGVREMDDGRRDPLPLVKGAEARCAAEFTQFAREFRGRPWVCTDLVPNGMRGNASVLSDRAVAACFVNYIKVLREHRVARLIAYRENHVKY
jgi:hypothetical protein